MPKKVQVEQKKEQKEDKKICLDEDVKEKLKTLVEICKEVATTLKKGRVECVYQEAICQELQLRGIRYVSEETIQITYKGIGIGTERIDIRLTNWFPSGFIFELKATASEIKQENLWQVISYLEAKEIPYGAVVNFNQSVKGNLEIQFLVFEEGQWYLYDSLKGTGKEMLDYSY